MMLSSLGSLNMVSISFLPALSQWSQFFCNYLLISMWVRIKEFELDSWLCRRPWQLWQEHRFSSRLQLSFSFLSFIGSAKEPRSIEHLISNRIVKRLWNIWLFNHRHSISGFSHYYISRVSTFLPLQVGRFLTYSSCSFSFFCSQSQCYLD